MRFTGCSGRDCWRTPTRPAYAGSCGSEAWSTAPIEYKGVVVETGYRADLIVDGKVLVELKAIDRLLSIHEAQVLTYLRLSGVRVGLLINFNVISLKHGIRRFIRKAETAQRSTL